MLANDLKLVTKDIAAEVFSVSVKTIDNYIKDGLLPPPKRFVSKEYWHPADFAAFLDRTSRGEPAAVDGVTGVTGVTDAPAAGQDSAASPTTPATRTKPTAREKDTSPVVRQRARRSALLDRLNAAN